MSKDFSNISKNDDGAVSSLYLSKATGRIAAGAAPFAKTSVAQRNNILADQFFTARMRGTTRSKMLALWYMTHPGRPTTGTPSR